MRVASPTYSYDYFRICIKLILKKSPHYSLSFFL